ncbi:O-antigen ligase family protein [Rhodococcus sp. GG48]|nr:O-antigen ligase family protein [Rhodococcus sp. GG48]
MDRSDGFSVSSSVGRLGSPLLLGLVAVLVAAAGGFGVVASPVAILAAVALATAAVMATRPIVLLQVTIVLAVVSLPDWIPETVTIAGFQARLGEVTLGLFVLTVILIQHSDRVWGGHVIFLRGLKHPVVYIAVLSLTSFVALCVGVSSGASISVLWTDIRGIFQFLVCVVVAAAVVKLPARRTLLRTFQWSIVASAVLLVLADTAGVRLHGRSEVAQLYRVGGGVLSQESSVRYLTSSTVAALFVLCAILGMMLGGRRPSPVAWTSFAASIVICFYSYSRYQVLAIAAAFVCVLVVLLARGRFKVAGRAVIGCSVIAVSIVLAAGAMSGTAFYDQLESRVSGYTVRVFGGLTSSTRDSDTSTQDRVVENQYMTAAIEDAPFLGHGYGYAYKPKSGPADRFAANGGQFYGHNYYFWLLMKTGILGLASFVLVLLAAMRRMLRKSADDPEALGILATLAGASVCLAIAH